MPKNERHATICFPNLQCGTFVGVVLLRGLFKQAYSGHVDVVMRMNADALATLPSERHARPTQPSLCAITLHTDMDRGDGRTKYVLRGEGAGSVFVIDEKTGNIHVTKPLDREEKDEYRLIATATDSQTERALEPSSQFIIRVQDINDNPPVFEDGPYSAAVPEMANIGTSIIQVTASDADDPTYGNSARLVYTLVQGQPHFSVDPQTGILRTAVPDLDREAQDQYLVVLQAKDMGGHLGGLSGTTTVTVRLTDVNDNPPHFTQSCFYRGETSLWRLPKMRAEEMKQVETMGLWKDAKSKDGGMVFENTEI
ncbi:putative cadherin-4 [Triplophysa rosa]|uniref:Cadherin-4 n=1 Tax=Triplophysa rosa TaxID=992332 RepID=A0A9W8C7X0_TRIRA|nr:putative cadherin-4 [Triplophysa rosa]